MKPLGLNQKVVKLIAQGATYPGHQSIQLRQECSVFLHLRASAWYNQLSI